jgi:PPOX class probable F420-dependent enzyme
MNASNGQTPPASASDWARVAAASFVSLGTFRRSGVMVATPVWIAADGESLVVTTERATGKVKRVRNDGAVQLRPCSRMGAVDPDAPVVHAVATIASDTADERSAVAALKQKYGLQFRLFLGVERLVRRLQRRPGDRVILRIVPAATA